MQAVVGVEEMPFAIVFLLHVHGQVEHRAQFLDISCFLLLKGEVAAGLQAAAVDLGHDILDSLAGLEIVAALDKGLDEHLQAKAGAIGDEVHVDGGVGLDEGDVAGAAAAVGGDGRMHGHEGGDVADGGQHLFACRFRNGDAVLAGDLGDAPMIVVDADDLHPGRGLAQVVDVVAGDRVGKADMEVFAALLDQQLRLAGHEFHRGVGRGGKVEVGVADHLWQGLVHGQDKIDVLGLRGLDFLDFGADAAVLAGEVGQGPALVEAGQGNRTTFGPATILAKFLLARGDLETLALETDHPDKPGLVAGGIVVLGGGEDQGLQRAPPRLFRFQQGEQGDDAGLSAQRGEIGGKFAILRVGGEEFRQELGKEQEIAVPALAATVGDNRQGLGIDGAIEPILAETGEDHGECRGRGQSRDSELLTGRGFGEIGGNDLGEETVGRVLRSTGKQGQGDADFVGDGRECLPWGAIEAGEDIEQPGRTEERDFLASAEGAEKVEILGKGGQTGSGVAAEKEEDATGSGTLEGIGGDIDQGGGLVEPSAVEQLGEQQSLKRQPFVVV